MKKVVHIFSEINYSGAELMWYGAIDILRKNNYDLILISTGDTKGNFSSSFEKKNIKVYHLPIKNRFVFLLNMYKLLNKLQPDVVHIHPENKHLYFYYSLFSKLVNAKAIRTIHSICNSRLTIYGLLMRKLSKLLGCKFVSISKSVQQNEVNIYKNDTFIINNWADNNRFKPLENDKVNKKNQLGLPTDKILLVSIGNCAIVKNHKLILEALKLLNDDYFYVHIGKEDSTRSELELSKQLDIEDKMVFLGAKTNIEKYLQVCDIFIMPSLYEGVGNAAIEAIMTEIKVILTDVKGLNAFKKYSPLVNYIDNNPEDLYNMILKVSDINIEDSFNIRENIINNYGIEQGIKKYLELYEN